MRALLVAAAVFAASVSAGSAASVSFSFGTSPAKENQSVISQTSGGVTLDVTGVRCDDYMGPNDSSCGSALIDEWGTGIGLWASYHDNHQVDGYYKNEFLKLTLSKVMTLASASFTYFSADDDFVAYGWNAITSTWDYIVGGDACESNCGWANTVHTYDFDSATYTSDMFLIGARGSDDDWKFKGAAFDHLSAVPLPAAGWLLIAGLGGLAALKRRKVS